MAFIRKYNKTFDLSHEDENGNQTYDDLGIEFWCLRKGKEWIESEGRTLEFHYNNVRRIIWPELDEHRWHDLCTKEIVHHKVTVLMGPGSSGKTHEMAWIGLVNYWLRPEQTCVLVASTHLGGLKKRVWAEICMLWEQGVERFPKLSGHLLDSAIAITTDNVEDCDPGERKIRDMRKGVFGVACWPSGTYIDTPAGKVAIEKLNVGDIVINACGTGRISATMSKVADRLVRVTLCDGRKLDCTDEHPFFTNRGWVKAIDLKTYDLVYSAHETMRLLQTSTRSRIPESKTLLCHLSKLFFFQREMPTMRSSISSKKKETESEKNWRVLLARVCWSLGVTASRMLEACFSKVWPLRQAYEAHASQSEILLSGVQASNYGQAMLGVRRSFQVDKRGIGKIQDNFLQSILQAEMGWEKSGKSEIHPHDSRKYSVGNVQGLLAAISNLDWPKNWKGLQALVSARCGFSKDKAGNRNRWWNSSNASQDKKRRQENRNPKQAWVDSVEILQPSSSEQYSNGESGYLVHNLEVESHPSYSVNGVIVHNCITGGKFVGLAKFVGIKQKYMILLADEASMMGETFLSAFANLNKNENFQAIVSGNPNDPLDPLGRAAEPKEGWTDDYMEPTKTKVWDTRFMNGRCVNLIGLDSPNFDFPADKPTRYRYLISHEKINDTLSFFPKDSMEYYSQCVGSMKIGTIARRVLSRAMAKEYHAQEQAIWRDENRTRVYFVDSSYGGDRCVAGWGEFGFDVDGKQILSLDTPKIIPILIGKGVEPEDQIARFVKLDCEQEMIPPENMGHDATGRGSLGTSLAREWSAMTNPIDAGGRPTKRPVSLEITIVDPDTGQKRPKRCDEHYDRLVSEFWFSVRYCVESNQMRGLNDEALEELCARKWDRIRGDKYAVEVKSGTPNKPGMKERTGKSPDLGDWVAGIVEMARRKGFIISKLGNPEKTKSSSDDWFKTQAAKLEKFRQSRQLQSA